MQIDKESGLSREEVREVVRGVEAGATSFTGYAGFDLAPEPSRIVRKIADWFRLAKE